MTSDTTLTLTFLDRAPRAAARVLQELAAEDAAALLEVVPARIAAPVVIEMIPWQAARQLELLGAPRAALILRQLRFLDAVSLVRLIRQGPREKIYDELPRRYARRLERALVYPENQIGAWIDPDVPALTVEERVGDALRILGDAENVSHVFLLSANRRELVGTVPIRELLRSEPSAPLAALGIVKIVPLSNRAPLSSVTFDPRWDECLHLPVVGRRGNLLGGLSRHSLRNGLHAQSRSRRPRGPSIAYELLGAFFSTCVALLVSAAHSDDRHALGPGGGSANGR